MFVTENIESLIYFHKRNPYDSRIVVNKSDNDIDIVQGQFIFDTINDKVLMDELQTLKYIFGIACKSNHFQFIKKMYHICNYEDAIYISKIPNICIHMNYLVYEDGNLEMAKFIFSLNDRILKYSDIYLLSMCIKKGHVHMIEWMYEKYPWAMDSIINNHPLPTSYGCTDCCMSVFDISCKNGDLRMTKWLHSKIRPNIIGGHNTFIYACDCSNEELVKWIINDKIIDVDYEMISGALIHCCVSNKLGTFKLLFMIFIGDKDNRLCEGLNIQIFISDNYDSVMRDDFLQKICMQSFFNSNAEMTKWIFSTNPKLRQKINMWRNIKCVTNLGSFYFYNKDVFGNYTYNFKIDYELTEWLYSNGLLDIGDHESNVRAFNFALVQKDLLLAKLIYSTCNILPNQIYEFVFHSLCIKRIFEMIKWVLDIGYVPSVNSVNKIIKKMRCDNYIGNVMHDNDTQKHDIDNPDKEIYDAHVGIIKLLMTILLNDKQFDYIDFIVKLTIN